MSFPLISWLADCLNCLCIFTADLIFTWDGPDFQSKTDDEFNIRPDNGHLNIASQIPDIWY